MNIWFSLLKTIAPIVLVTVKPELAPIATQIVAAVEEAENLPHATGLEKLAYVKKVALTAAQAVNLARGREVINLATLDMAVTAGVAVVIAVLNLTHRSV